MNKPRQRGVTLLELLVALAIFALSASALLRILGEHGRHAGVLETRYFAQLAAHNHLSELHLQPTWPAVGKRTRQVELGGHAYSLTELVEHTDDADIRHVTIRMSESGQELTELQAFMGPTP